MNDAGEDRGEKMSDAEAAIIGMGLTARIADLLDKMRLEEGVNGGLVYGAVVLITALIARQGKIPLDKAIEDLRAAYLLIGMSHELGLDMDKRIVGQA